MSGRGGTVPLRIVNPDHRYARVDLVAPTGHGYVHVAAAVRPNPVPHPLRTEPDKTRLIARLKRCAEHLERRNDVERAAVFDAIAMPPIDRCGYLQELAAAVRPARFDVVVMIEATSIEAARGILSTPEFTAVSRAFDGVARQMHVMTARAARRLGYVDTSCDGLFAFGYFVAEDPQVVPELWRYLAGWYAAETDLDDAALLVPLDGTDSDYVAIEAARWDVSVPGYFARQLSKKTFRTYVHANLDANHVGVMPVLYRLA